MSSQSPHHHLYNTRAWRLRRISQLFIEPLCRMHRALNQDVPATVADHIEPHNGDPIKFYSGPLQSLCKPCHDSIKQSQERTGRLRGCDAAGAPLDPTHPWNNVA